MKVNEIAELEAFLQLGDTSKEAAGRRVYVARLVLDMRQTELAQVLGTESQALSNIEKGRNNPNVRIMTGLYRMFGFDFNFIMYGTIAGVPIAHLPRLLEISETAI